MTRSFAFDGPQRFTKHGPAKSAKTFAEFFAGIGLVDEGLRGSGWNCIYANDISPVKKAMHADRNGTTPHYHLGDVRAVDEVISRLLDHDPFLATASFPCVDLSTAGHYRGFHGDQSSTFFAFTDILEALGDRRPKLVMLENVVGFLTSRNGADFTAAAGRLADLGYWLDAFVLDARCFVPQSRPRVFVIGMADDLRPARAERRSFSLVSEVGPTSLRPPSLVRIIRSLPLATGWRPLDLAPPPQRRQNLTEVVDLDDGQEWWDNTQVERHYRMMSELHRQRIDTFRNVGSPFVGTIFRRVRKEGQRAEVRFDGLAGCLRTPKGGSGRQIVIAVNEGRIRMRWMSAREYARLQGSPDFPLQRPTNQLLLGFADAVCVPAVAWIDRNVLTPLYEAAFPGCRPDHARQPHARATTEDNAGRQGA